jgi:peptide/nickel transport system substrate-binding protein
MPKEPVTLDLTNDASSGQSDLVMANVCERLNKLNPDLSLGPGLATKFEFRTPTTLVFTLRDNVTFHDGAPMTADDVVWSMTRNGTDGNNESDEFVNVTNIAATGAHEVTFTLKQPDAVLPQALAGDAGIVQSKKMIEAQGKAFGTASGKDACTGPLALKQWNPGRDITLVKAPNYWDKDHASKTDEITFKWMGDDAIVNTMLTGAADGVYLENLATATQLAGRGSMTVSQGPDTRVWSLMATERGPLKDARVRNALSLALDRDGVNRAAFAGLGQPWKEPVGSGAWGYEKQKFQAAYDQLGGAPDRPTKDDLEQAKKLVKEAGQVQEIIVASDSSPARNALANAVVDAAGKIGLKASLIQIPTAQYAEYYDSPDARQKADLYSDDYYISKNDPVGFYKNGASTSSVQWLLKDPEYDALVKKARAELDNAARADLAVDMAKRWAAARPWISAVQSPSTVVLSSKVTGVPASGAYRYYPWAADLGTKGA